MNYGGLVVYYCADDAILLWIDGDGLLRERSFSQDDLQTPHF